MSISTIVTGGYSNGVFETTIAELTLSGYSINPLFIVRTPRKMVANSNKRLMEAESSIRLMTADSTNRKMES